jgi:membrane-associated phospholipid phosphatase
MTVRALGSRDLATSTSPPPRHHLRPGTAETAAHVARQAVAVAAAVLGYVAVRGLTDANPATAMRDAGRVMAAERLLHLDLEIPLQRSVVGHPDLTQALDWIYIFGHWPVIAATLLWLAIRHRDVFARARNAMLLSGAVGLVVFAAFPVAPPRLADRGLVDTVTRQSDAYRVLQPPAFTDEYAAMPSLHVGWNLLMTLAILAAARATWLRVLAVALTLSMDATVVLTANHYVVDGLAGAALSVACWHLAGALPARRRIPSAMPWHAEERAAT